MKKILIIVGCVVGAVAYTVLVGAVSVWLYKADQGNKQAAIDPKKIVQEALANNVNVNTVERHITWRDMEDRSMFADWKLKSDFSNTRRPKTMGTLTVSWLSGQTEYKQELEMVIIAATAYKQTGYFRIVEGNAVTGASKDWVKIENVSLYAGNSSTSQLYNRQALYGSGAKVFRSVFKGNAREAEFSKFAGFNFAQYNDPAFYVITGNMRDGQDKANIVQDIKNNRAYVMQDCQKNDAESWCSGTTNAADMGSISARYYASEGMGGKSLTFDSTQYVMVADTATKQLKKFEMSFFRDDKFTVEFSNFNQPLEVKAPL